MEDQKEQSPVVEAPEMNEKEEVEEEMDEDKKEYMKNLEEAKHFMECQICYVEFDNAQHIPLGQQCGHTICSTCIRMN